MLPEPIDRAAVDERREHTAACAEAYGRHTRKGVHIMGLAKGIYKVMHTRRAVTCADRRHGQHHVQVLSHQIHIVLQNGLSRLELACLFRQGAHQTHDLLQLVVLVQIGHLAAVEDVVDVFQKGLRDNLL